ncbi:MAG: hypothetical protein FWF79_06655 [Defluviitaleaceae bacterium]|nr:hypothetical protein [Defluviitaleaceae bacterium]
MKKKLTALVAFIIIFLCFTLNAHAFSFLDEGCEGNWWESSGELIAIYVSFRTPSAVALRLAYGGDRHMDIRPFEEQALVAHKAFQEQFNALLIHLSLAEEDVEVLGKHHLLVNLWIMRVPSDIVPHVKELPEVSYVSPHHYPKPEVPVPTVSGVPTANSITLTTIAGAEYRIATPFLGIWQSSPTFDGLTADTAYTFQARFAAINGNPYSGPSPASAVIRTASNFGDVPNTSVPGITGYTLKMFAFLTIATFGIYKLCREFKETHG